MTPLVSILIPTYNRARFLSEAIESARVQTYSAVEILVLDDASPDETAEIAQEFSRDSRVQHVRNSRNLGIAGNWRVGLKRAQGSFFCFLHDDDTFEPTFVEELLEPLRQDDRLILSFCDHWAMNASGERLPGETNKISTRFKRNTLPLGLVQNFARSALIDYSVPIGATLFRHAMVDPAFFAPEARGAIDAYLLYQCVRTESPAFYVPKRLMNYRVHGGGMSVSMPLHMAEGHLYRLQRILSDHSLQELHQDTRHALHEMLADYGIALLSVGRLKDARIAFAKSLTGGWSRRSLVGLVLATSGRAGVLLTSWWRGRRASRRTSARRQGIHA